jgi:hypothetical protein
MTLWALRPVTGLPVGTDGGGMRLGSSLAADRRRLCPEKWLREKSNLVTKLGST